MREDVRAWLLARPALIRQLRGADAGPLVVVAPYLRLEDGRWQLPGGPLATPVWTALVGAPSEAPEAWLLALVRAEGGLLTYFAEVLATLSPDQQLSVLLLAEPEVGRRVAAGAELLDGVRSATHGWDLRSRPFWRPSIDPAFLLAQIEAGRAGRVALPGGRLFWTLVFADGALVPRPAAARAAWDDETPVSAGWLLPRIWLAAPAEQTVRYEQVLFASRRLAGVEAARATEVATIVRGYARYPQLLRLLDRLEVADPGRLAALVRRAEALSAAASDWRGHAAVVRWQCALLFLDTMARLGALEADELQRALDVLAAADVEEPSPRPSRGTQVRALLAGLGVGARSAGDLPARAVEDALLARLTRSGIGNGRRVIWEDQAYRLDVGAAERDRLARVRGRDAQPRLDAAWAIFGLSDRRTPPEASEALARLQQVVAATRLDRTPGPDERLGIEARAAAAAARRLLERGRILERLGRDSRRARRSRRRAGDRSDRRTGLCAEPGLGRGPAVDRACGLAASCLHPALGGRPRRRVLDGARDHDGARQRVARRRQPAGSGRRARPRRTASAVVEATGGGAVLEHRRSPLAGDHGGRRRSAGVHRRGAAGARRCAAARPGPGPGEAGRPSRSGACRRGRCHAAPPGVGRMVRPRYTPAAFPDVLSTSEILRLGFAGQTVPESLSAWGTAQRPVSGRLTAGPFPAWPWERYAGRSQRLVSCALPDLQVTLAVRLAAMELPAMLVVDLLPSATYELVNGAVSRHADDFDALAEHVRAVDQAALERYLGLLTTAGPLRPVPAGSR